VRAELQQDLGDGPIRVAGLALLDEQRVLHHPRRVEEQRDALLGAVGMHGTHVGHRDRLAAGHVDGPGKRDVRDLRRAHLVDQRAQLGEVHVALERVKRGRVVRLVDDHVGNVAPASSWWRRVVVKYMLPGT